VEIFYGRFFGFLAIFFIFDRKHELNSLRRQLNSAQTGELDTLELYFLPASQAQLVENDNFALNVTSQNVFFLENLNFEDRAPFLFAMHDLLLE
jgi:hypothetical protein